MQGDYLMGLLCGEGHGAREQAVKEHAQGIDVRAAVDSIALCLLRGCVFGDLEQVVAAKDVDAVRRREPEVAEGRISP